MLDERDIGGGQHFTRHEWQSRFVKVIGPGLLPCVFIDKDRNGRRIFRVGFERRCRHRIVAFHLFLMSDTKPRQRKVLVVGGGPVGSLTALSFAKRGWAVELWETRDGESSPLL